ncbi:hypothetical protein BGZ97_004930, partial [Linnemannia gamsii]
MPVSEPAFEAAALIIIWPPRERLLRFCNSVFVSKGRLFSFRNRIGVSKDSLLSYCNFIF